MMIRAEVVEVKTMQHAQRIGIDERIKSPRANGIFYRRC